MDFIFDPSLVLYLPLYELDGASFMSKDKHGHLCTVTGALWTPRGRSFDGLDDYVRADNTMLRGIFTSSGVSLEGWFKTDDTTVAQLIGGYIKRIQTYTSSVCFGIGLYNNNTLVLKTKSTGIVTSISPSAVGTEWHHFAGTYDGSIQRLYLDGIEVDSDAQTGDLSTLTYQRVEFGAGHESATGYDFFNGLIPEIRLYRRALTPQEIQHNYLATKWRYR